MSIYTRLYDNLVESRKCLKEQWEPVGSGLERHHILPKHAGGTEEESNFTYLSHREHIAAHWLLWKIHGRQGDLIAWTGNAKKQGHWKHTEESKKKMCEAQKGRKNQPHSEETKRKMSAAHTGKKKSKEHIENLSKALRGRYREKSSQWGLKRTEESKKKMSERAKNRKVIVCPHCDTSATTNMTRWHFDNCKLYPTKKSGGNS